ncbi:MAG: DNA polymerase III subunit chi [Burkholderiaceae bacterium]|jgi:DNA polymerase-3 subunit chi|nr:DNA polymerase III subunit chi [Burkholderiaceae bacterium]
MTEIAFHFNVPDKLHYACRLLRKVYQSGNRARVVGDADTLATLDQALWTFAAQDFIPHCQVNASAALLAHTPIVLATAAGDQDCGEALVNLGAAVPAGFEHYARLIELVSQSEADRADARQRWRHYADGGYAITRYDWAASPSNP